MTPAHFNYTPGETKIEPVPFRTQVAVEVQKNNLYSFKELNPDLQYAISRDLQTSGFSIGSTVPADMTATFHFNKIIYNAQPWGLLWLGFVYLGAPSQRDKATVDVDLTLTDAEQQVIGQYSTTKTIAKWQGLYYKYYLANLRDERNIVSAGVTLAMDDLKSQIAADRTQIVQAVQESSPTGSQNWEQAAALPVVANIDGMSLAVLPFANETTDLTAGELARLLFALGLQEKGYQVLDNETVDAKLRELGITDGGQLNSITENELTEALQVEGLVYGTLLEAEYSTKAVASTKKATIAVRIVKNSQTAFDDRETSADSQTGSSLNVVKSFANQLIDKTSEKAFAKYHGHPLELQIETAVYKLQDRIPGQRVEKSGWTNKPGNPMVGTTVIPTFQGPGLGFRSWTGTTNGFGLEIQPSWDFSDITMRARYMYAFKTNVNSRTYGLVSLGYMKVRDKTTVSFAGISSTVKINVSLPTFVIGGGWEKLYGIRKNHGLSIEGGLQIGRANYNYKTVMHDVPYLGDYTYSGKDTYKASPIYLGVNYCWYFKK